MIKPNWNFALLLIILVLIHRGTGNEMIRRLEILNRKLVMVPLDALGMETMINR
jgi:preprotein translocase subunit SecG